MPTIKGPVTFKKGKALSKKVKDALKISGINTPLSPENFSYSNDKLDTWLRLKKKVGGKYKYDRVKGKSEKELDS